MGKASRRKQRSGVRPAGAGDLSRRVREHESSVADAYPGAWMALARFREGRDPDTGREIPEARDAWWPSWCWLPQEAANAVVERHALAPQVITDGELRTRPAAMVMIGLATWRQTRTIYRLDPDLFAALLDTDLRDKLPAQAFQRLPEWGVYVTFPPITNEMSGDVHGMFAWLNYDLTVNRPELHLLADHGDGQLLPITLYLDRPTIGESLLDMTASMLANLVEPTGLHDIRTGGDPAVVQVWRDRAEQARGELMVNPVAAMEGLRPVVDAMLSALLYLCADEPDIIDPDEPPETAAWTPRPPYGSTRVKLWEVGYRVGSTIRAGADRDRNAPTARHAGPRPHVRRAHWHHYWTGPRNQPDERKLVLRWVHPTLVGGPTIIDTIRDV